MKELMRPSKFIAIVFTIAATCSLITLLLMITVGHEAAGLVAFQVFTAGLLLIAAIGNWYLYTKKFIRYEVEKRLEEGKDDQSMGKAHVYKRDHINTDEIIPARYLNMDDEKELAKHCLEDLDKEFVRNVRAGDVIVAGEDFGCGSSREHAVWAIRGAKVQTVIAKSFARIFYRNAINCGFYLIESPDALEKISDADEVEIDYEAGLIKNKTTGADITFSPLPDFALEIVRDGGLLEHIGKTM
jgi:3-isopropylmalate/(R)-2-methylmalate dehydratase small subunit